MAREIRIPKLGLTMTDAVLVRWLFGAGERMTKEQAVCVIETDKVSFEMPAPEAGLLHPVVEAGRRVAVGELIGYVAADEAELGELHIRYAAAATGSVGDEDALDEPTSDPPPSVAVQTQASGERVVATPAARRFCKEHGIELKEISGSGPGGRIILGDVEKGFETFQRKQTGAMYDFGSLTEETEMLTVAEKIPIRGIRKIIFKNMKLSLASQAQLTLHTDASAKAMGEVRRLFNARLTDKQSRVSYNAVIVKAAAQALRRYPMLNSAVEGREIKVWEQIHIGVAMDFGHGLIVPKIRNADTKSLLTISDELNDLAKRAEKKKLFPDELSGGTFTITNLGGWDIDHFTPIVNFPESAILGVGRIMEKPWVRNSTVVAEPRISLSLTFDHRIIDGAPAAQFLKTLTEMLEALELMI